jgi:site-specific DNA recombinase
MQRVVPARARAVAYVRVSTEKQADHGVSLAAQRSKVEAYATLYDLELVETVVDAGVSAKDIQRPGLQKALRALEGGLADAVVVVKLDRLTRSVRDLGNLVEQYFATGRFSLLSVGEQIDTRSAAGRLVLNVLASVAQWEREATGERTRLRCVTRLRAGSSPVVGCHSASDLVATASSWLPSPRNSE